MDASEADAGGANPTFRRKILRLIRWLNSEAAHRRFCSPAAGPEMRQ